MKPAVGLAILLAALLVVGCGQKTPLEPAPGMDLPPAPYGRTVPLDSEELLELDPMAAPERTVELRRRSEPREDDPFDLPPP
jgi:hypothetical protein